MENPILQKQSLTILQKIEELKNWHRRQKSNLETSGTTEHFDNLPKRFKNDGIRDDADSQSAKSKGTQQNFDEIPIKSTSSNIDKVIENNISPNDNQTDVCEKSSVKPKFRFLKKGEGIARFRMGPQKPPERRSNNNIWTLNLAGAPSKFPEGEPNLNLSEENICIRNEVSTLKPPDLKLDLNNWKNIYDCETMEELIEKAINSNQLSQFQPDSSIDSSAASFMERCIAVGKKHLKEAKELRVFESLERHVLDSSFSSSSSYISRLMENAVISTPIKNPRERKHIQDQHPKTNSLPTVILEHEEVIKNTKQSKPEPAVWIDPRDTKKDDAKSQDQSTTSDLEQSLHVKFAEKVDYKSFTDYSQSINNSNPKSGNDSHKELDESEEWKEDSGDDSECCSQCSTAYSSSDEDVKAISPLGKPPTSLRNNVIRHEAVHKNKQINRNSVEKLDVEDLEAKEDPRLNIICSNDVPVDKVPPIFNSKMKELESEIETYRVENKKLKTLRENLERERKNFNLEKKKLLLVLEEEKKKNAAYLEEEKQKLSKEKLVFQKYSKTLTKTPSKEERKEIQGLKEQLTDLKEELNRKESRWGAAQARVRNQVKVLEEDNKKLREEVEVLRKQAKHLEFLTQKKNKPFNNTKLIHAINELVSNAPISEEIAAKNVSNGGYFNSKPIADEVDPKHVESVKVIKENRKENGVRSKSIEETYKQMVLCNEPVSKGNFSNLSDPIQLNGVKNGSKEISGRANVEPSQNNVAQNVQTFPKEVINGDGTVEKVYPDGKKEIKCKNGNIKKIDPFAGNEKIIYFNGDVKENFRDGTVRYFFSEDRIWHTTLPDGLEILDFSNGQVEKRYTNGTVEISYPDNSKKLIFQDGAEEIEYPDGTKQKTEADQSKVIWFPNGQREVHTAEFKRREYPDGTVKTVYADGVTETNYSSGRVRVKDKFGNLVMDSATLTY